MKTIKPLTSLIKLIDTFFTVDKQYTQTLVNSWPIFFIAASGICFSMLAFFPGWMSADSLVQYAEGNSGMYADWHPALMAYWWGYLDKIYTGPSLMLSQNVLLYWGGVVSNCNF